MSTAITGLVVDPGDAAYAAGSYPVAAQGRSGELLTSGVHGKYYAAAYYGNVFTANRTAVTIPVVASNLVSVFSLYNPSGSGVNAELIDLDIANVLATTVVNAFGLYFQNSAAALGGATYTTVGVANTNIFSGVMGATPGNSVLFYSALTHAGTPVRYRHVGGNWAVTSTDIGSIHYEFDGKVIVPPGTIVSLAASTAAGTTSGLDPQITWAEFPV